VPSRKNITVEQAATPDPFAVPARSISSLRQYGTVQSFNRRIRVSAVVTNREAGGRLDLQNGEESLTAFTSADSPARVGDLVDVVGFPGREAGRVILREAICRRVSDGTLPPPVEVTTPAEIDADLDGRIVKVTGTVVEAANRPDGVSLTMQADNTIFEALMDTAAPGPIPDKWATGSRLEVSGVCDIQFGEYGQPRGFHVDLRTPADVKVLREAPWWTVQRTLGISVLLAGSLLLGGVWVFVLRRQVRRQTARIRAQVATEARLEAELQRASKLESLGILAGGIAHDFNNLLTVVIGNLSLVLLEDRLEEDDESCVRESERAAVRARDLTQQLLTFAKGGAPVRTAVLLADIVRESAEFALHGSKVRCEFSLPADAWPADVDKGQIAQVVHNIVLNGAEAMTAGGVIRVALQNETITDEAGVLKAGRYLRLSISDSGTGMSPEHLVRIFDPYFTTKQRGSGLGLATVYSIIKRHGGHVDVQSKLGEGTTFAIWLPAADAAPVAEAKTGFTAPAGSARILFMDDEPPIRKMAVTMIQRFGFEVTAVADGAAALREFTAAREEGQPYDLVILDLTVPGGMGGIETLKRLREIEPNILAVVSSGYSADPVMANYRAHGFHGMVPKPYEIGEAARVIGDVLQKPLE
jgi:signal transduction histidine kinase/CheY-like chemotaxis protein